MRRKFTFAIVFFAYLFSSNSHAATLEEIKQQLQSTPYMLEVPADNTAIFSTYCTGDSISAQIPQPNYANPLVLAAAKKLTEAKTLANTRLTDKSKAKFIKNLESTKQEVAQLVQNAKNPQIKGLLEILLKDLNQPNISNLSESGVNAYTELKQVLLANLKSNVTALAPLLQKELKSISVNDFTVLINKLVPKLKKEIPPVDFKKLSTLTDSINSVFKKMDVPFDNLILKKTTEQILSLKDQKKNEELASLQEDAQGLLTALDNPPKKQPEFLSNYVETIYDELTYQNDNIANNPILVQARGVFEKEYIKAYVKKVITHELFPKELFESQN